MLYNNINGGKLTMIYDSQVLQKKYENYSNIGQKIRLETKNNKLIKIKRGLYTDDLMNDCLIIANICYNPSYISFEYALSFYNLIPEHVSIYTSACFAKKNNKKYVIDNIVFEYRSIPSNVFSFGIDFLINENGIRYKIANKEKALCDTLYSKYPVRSIKDLKILLFDDLRIDEEEFMKLDFEFIKSIALKYHSNTISTLVKYINEVTKNDNFRTNN